MSDLRKAAKMALEVMEYNRANGTPNMGAAIEALRQALAQPEWVGLTKKDLKPLCDQWKIIYGGYVDEFACAIEAKLKEKNT